MRLIDVNVAKGYFLKDGGQHPTKKIWQYGAIAKELDNIPPIDAVEVVRCGECRFYGELLGEKMCKRQFTCIQMNPTNFCSYGKRKEAHDAET